MSLGDDPMLRTLQTQMESLRVEIGELRDTLQGRPHLGWTGLVTRTDDLDRRVRAMRETQDAFVRREEQRQQDLDERDAKRDRFANWTFTIMGSVLSGVVLLLVSTLLTGGGL